RSGATCQWNDSPDPSDGRVVPPYATPPPPVSPRPQGSAVHVDTTQRPGLAFATVPLPAVRTTGRSTEPGAPMAFLPLRRVDLPAATNAAYELWLGAIAEELSDPGCDRNELCRRILTDIYYPQYRDADPRELPEPTRIALLQMDPRNITLEPEYYAEIDPARYYPVKPLIWLWEM